MGYNSPRKKPSTPVNRAATAARAASLRAAGLKKQIAANRPRKGGVGGGAGLGRGTPRNKRPNR